MARSHYGVLSSTHSFGMSSETRQASTMVKLGDSLELGIHNVIKSTMPHLSE
jgi:hypothetical protein